MIKILTSHHITPDVRSFRTLIFDRILPILKTKSDIHITWLVYTPDKLNLVSAHESDLAILDIHDFKNAVEVIKKVNPDVIHASPYPNLPDYSLALAGKYLGIPVFGEVVNQLVTEDSLSKMIKLNLSAFFQKSVPTDSNQNQKQFMRRGRFWIYKYKFLLRTQIAIKMNKMKIIKNFFTILQVYFSPWKKMNDSRFAVDYHFVEGQILMKKLVDEGFDESTLFLTGSPVYDYLFERSSKTSHHTKKDDKIHVLLLTHSMYEHGFWTRKQRDNIVREIVTEIFKHKNEMSLVVKIHPSSENLSDYQSLISPIDDSIPIFQSGDVANFIEDCDVVIAYSTSSAPIQALVLGKPIIMINVKLKDDIMLERRLVQECKDVTNIISLIKQVLVTNPATKLNVDNFFTDYFGSMDGHAAERMSNMILQIAQKKM